MKAKWKDWCKSCAGIVEAGDEIHFREGFLLCESCLVTFETGMTKDEREAAEREKRERAARNKAAATRRRRAS